MAEPPAAAAASAPAAPAAAAAASMSEKQNKFLDVACNFSLKPDRPLGIEIEAG